MTLRQAGMGRYEVVEDGKVLGVVKRQPRYCGGGWLAKVQGIPAADCRTRRDAVEFVQEATWEPSTGDNEHG